jgi:predicted RNA polymerase sigma factor
VTLAAVPTAGAGTSSGADASAAVADAHRREWAFVLAATARVTRDIDLAEECVQDAYVAALHAWSCQGVPRNPGAWLTTTRADAAGRLLLLEDQDRSRWDRDAIGEGAALVAGALRGGRPGRFALQAAIAALHAEAPSYGQTDWPQLRQLYGELLRAWPSPVVALNRAVVRAMVDGPEAALTEIAGLEQDARLAGYRYLPAAKADLLRRLGRRDDAAAAYRAALQLTDNAAERDFLTRRITEVTAPE